MGLRLPAVLLVGALVTGAASACSAHHVQLLPVAPLLPARGASCAVDVEDLPEPGTKPLAIVRCSDGLAGPDCRTLMREKACEAGGDILFGTHYEKSGDLVATIGKLSAESTAERAMTRPGLAP
jgi:hypothetical protein